MSSWNHVHYVIVYVVSALQASLWKYEVCIQETVNLPFWNLILSFNRCSLLYLKLHLSTFLYKYILNLYTVISTCWPRTSHFCQFSACKTLGWPWRPRWGIANMLILRYTATKLNLNSFKTFGAVVFTQNDIRTLTKTWPFWQRRWWFKTSEVILVQVPFSIHATS